MYNQAYGFHIAIQYAVLIMCVKSLKLWTPYDKVLLK